MEIGKGDEAAARERRKSGFPGRRVWGPAVFFAFAGFSFGLSAQTAGEADSEAYLERLEWRGILALPDQVQFSFHDASAKRSFWISPGQVRNGIEVVEYDGKLNEVVLRHGEATRSLTLSDSVVVGLEGQPTIAPPPLVVVNPSGGQNNSLEGTGAVEFGSEEGRMAGLWRQAIGQSPQIQEIDQQFKNINVEERNIAQALAGLDENDPAYETMAARQQELQEERRVLMEGAFAELRSTPGLNDEAKRELAEGLREGFSTELRPPEPEPIQEAGAPPVEQGAPTPDQAADEQP